MLYNLMNVDEVYSNKLVETLFDKIILEPGRTYSTNWDGNASAGVITAHKIVGGAAVESLPGTDYTNEDAKDELVSILVNKSFKKQYKVYADQSNAVAIDAQAAYLEQAVKEVGKGVQTSALKALADEGTQITGAALTAGTVYDQCVDLATSITVKNGEANTLIVNPAVYGLLLKSDEFQRVGLIGDAVVTAGFVGQVAGMDVFRSNSLEAGVDMIAYDFNTFALAMPMNQPRIKDGYQFDGVLVQASVTAGFKVMDADLVATRKTV